MGLRSTLRRWLNGPVHAWYHPSYRLPLAASVGAPMSPRRADDALTWALDTGVLSLPHVHEPDELSWADAGLVHEGPYLASLDDPAVQARILGAAQERIAARELLETWRRASGGTAAAARHVIRHGGRAVNLLGGFHHAGPERGTGFCALNDVAIAAACARRDGVRGPIGIIDLDAHPPDGIAACLAGDELVTILSIAVASSWEVPPAKAKVIDLRVPPRTADTDYLRALDALLGKMEGLPPFQLAFYLAGADPLRDDPLGGLSVSEEGLRERDKRVLSWLGRTPTVILPAGGYRERSWRVLAQTVALAARRERRVPEGYDPLQRRTRQIMAALNPSSLGQSALLTEEELLGSLGAAPRVGQQRWLGYYTRHGLEYALEAYGYLTTLRRLGFSGLRVELSGGGAGADRMKITAATAQGRQTLVDLLVSLRPLGFTGTASLPEELAQLRVLFVEWLELTDPRAPFTSRKPKLPGQQAPGLGMADETMQLLGRAAERLELCGVSFVPAHFHVAWMARDRFTVLDPVARGRMRAMARAVSALPLVTASQRLGGPGLPTSDGQIVRWEPVEMVIPLDPRLARHLEEGERQALEVEEALFGRILADVAGGAG